MSVVQIYHLADDERLKTIIVPTIKEPYLQMDVPGMSPVTDFMPTFGDLNEKHLNVAQAIGIRPLASREEAEKMKETLQYIATNDLYAVDSLTHSVPYLIPGAAALLDTIGYNFLDSLAAKGLNSEQDYSNFRTAYKRRCQASDAVATAMHPKIPLIATARHSMSVGNASRK